MNFKNIYKESKENVELSLLSHWTPGSHRMREAMLDLFKREPLMADPVFQSIFPWEETNDHNWKRLLHPRVVQMIEERDEVNRIAGKPYPFVPFRHQTESWRALTDKSCNNSIVVTSGTGSGKTECFMLPVLSDLCSRAYASQADTPVEALFLYPLNALMQDQKDRLGSDCEKLDLRFAVYNSSLKNTSAKTRSKYPKAEVMTRERVRSFDSKNPCCPQILLTNPSMLEFMMVRDSDKEIFERSKGKLRWIVIDEAHTYTGSAAVELAYLLKRVLDAFGVKREDVHFVCTSATIGDRSNPKELTDFIDSIIGKIPANHPGTLIPIDGDRIVPSITDVEVQAALDAAGINQTTARAVQMLRQKINAEPMELQSIWNVLSGKAYSVETALELLDALCDIKVGDRCLLMLRGNFFMRAIEGLYACVNMHCPVNNEYRTLGIEYLTTEKGDGRCPHCGAPLFEVVQCGDCKEFIIKCDENDLHELKQAYSTPDLISIEDDGEDIVDESDQTDGGASNDNWIRTYLAFYGGGRHYGNPNPDYIPARFSLVWDATRNVLTATPVASGPWVTLGKQGRLYCPTCSKGSGPNGLYFHNFRLSADWLNGTVAPALLGEGRDANNEWGKYIAFTDSRQGTAVKAKRFNIESERAYARTRLVHELSKSSLPPLQEQMVSNLMKNTRETREKCMKLLGLSAPSNRSMSLSEAADVIYDKDIFQHIDYEASKSAGSNPYSTDENAYRTSLIRSIVGRRPMHQGSIESLGLVKLTYPAIDAITSCPSCWSLGLDSWKDFLKIAIDYVIRAGNHLQKPTESEYQYLRDSDFSWPIDMKDWPQVQCENGVVKNRQSRLVLLLCAAFGIKDPATLDARKSDVNRCLDEARSFLTRKILTKVDKGDPYYEEYPDCYYLDMTPAVDNKRVMLSSIDEAWVCPATNFIVDTALNGYSPMMSWSSGSVCPENLDRFRITSAVKMPKVGGASFDQECEALRKAGLWNDRLKYAYLPTKTAYLTAEHSGQQNREILDHYTNLFKSDPHKLNMLQCSTTMEMGVDIGDIDTVLMTNIPPTTANYLQRAGRAGRRGQTKAVAFALCPVTAIGTRAFGNPKRLITGINPAHKPKESSIIIQRHMNSFLIRQYLCSPDGMTVTFSKVDDWLKTGGIADLFIAWMRKYRRDSSLQAAFTNIFGSVKTIGRAMDNAESDLAALAKDYQTVINDINAEIASTPATNKAKIRALAIQAENIRNQELKGYLAEQQFLPNANMPTGIVEFNFMSAHWEREISKKKAKLDANRHKLQTPGLDDATKDNLRFDNFILEEDIDQIKARNKTSREIKVALSEYAPGQTVVIDEKNYVSAGIEWINSFGHKQPLKYLYHCPICGRYEYCEDQTLLQCTTPGCRGTFQGILAPNTLPYAIAIEPIRFRSDINRGSNRREKTVKTFYDIKTILTKVEWSSAIPGPMCDLVGSEGSEGQIVFFNQGVGAGFNLCLDCGRMEINGGDRNSTNWEHHSISERQDDHTFCPVNNPKNGLLLSGRFPTSFVSLRFYDGAPGNYVKDDQLLYSLGVLLSRALAKYIGVTVDDLDFDVRDEMGYKSIFIYDTMKGGCGYSTRLLDPATCNAVFTEAKAMLSGFTCNCERNEVGACVSCLVDRNSQKVENKLSKFKLMRWFASQGMSTEVSAGGATAYPVPLSYLLTALYSRRSLQSVTFCVDAKDMQLNEWINRDGAMGSILEEFIKRNKQVSIMVANVPSHSDNISFDKLLPFVDLSQKFSNWRIPVVAVDTIETTPGVFTALIVDGKEHYFTDQTGKLNFNADWGKTCTRLYEDNNVPSFTNKSFPTFSDITALLKSNEVIRYCVIPSGTRTRVDGLLPLLKQLLLKNGDDGDIRAILSGKKIDITFSDAYVNSALSVLLLVHLIKSLEDSYSFSISSVTLKLKSNRRKCENPLWYRLGEQTYICYNFPDEQSADDYIVDTFRDVLGVTPIISQEEPDHYRWIRLQERGATAFVEIRPDHGIGGGWDSKDCYMDLDYLDGSVVIESNAVQEPLFYLLIEK